MSVILAVLATVGALLVTPAGPAQAATTIFAKYCYYEATTPLREYSSGAWRIRGTALWYCDPEGTGSNGRKSLRVKLQELSSYDGSWFDRVGTEKSSSISDWGVPVTLTTKVLCKKAKFRTVAWPVEWGPDGKIIKDNFPRAYSSSKTFTTCS